MLFWPPQSAAARWRRPTARAHPAPGRRTRQAGQPRHRPGHLPAWPYTGRQAQGQGGITMTSLNFDIYLRSTPERVWAVLTDPGKVPAGRFGMSSHTDWHARHQVPGQTAEEEADSESAAGRRLRCEWLQTEHLTANGGHPSVVSFELTAMGEVTRLSLVHSHLTPGGSYLKVVAPGWPMLLSSLKSLVETGEPLEFRASA